MPNLTNDSIEIISHENELFLEKGKVKRKEALAIKVCIDNALTEWQHKLGAESELQILRTKFFGERTITIRCKGTPCNPFPKLESDEWSLLIGSFAESQINPPTYEYSDGENKISFTGKKQKRGKGFLLLLSIIFGIVLGVFGLLFLSEDVRIKFCNVFLKPIYTTYIGVCGLCGIPLIFLSVVNGVTEIGNTKTFSIIGSKMIKLFLLFIFVLTIITVVLGLGIFNPKIIRNETKIVYSDFVSLFLSIFPVNLLQPFIDSNAIQLIILGLSSGVAILLLGKTKCTLSKCMINLQEILLMFSVWITDFVPLFIVIGFVDTIWLNSFRSLLPVISPWVIITGFEIALIMGLVAFISVKYKVKIKTVLRKISKVFLIAFGTDSCSASIPENYSCCSTKLGISNNVFSFGIPIGTTIFKPATAIRLIILCFFIVRDSSMSISVTWLFVLTFLSICLSIACPAIPGGVLMLSSILLSNLGITGNYATKLLAIDVFFDSFCTAVNQIAVSLMLTIFAGREKLLDTKILIT